ASAQSGSPLPGRHGSIPASRDAQLRRACHASDVELRCLIVDDNPGFLEAAVCLLEREGMAVVGVASSCAEALARTEELDPDVVLVDVTLGRESGFELARRLAETDSGKRSVILISTHAEPDFADLIAKSPAAG